MAEPSRLSSSKQFREQVFQQSSQMRWLKAQIAAIAIAVGMLPVLGIGTVIYYFASQSIDHQIQEAKQEGAAHLATTTLPRQKGQLALLLLGTGATALLSGIVTRAWATRAFRSTLQTAADVKLEIVEQAKVERTPTFTEAISAIRKANTEADVLQTSVEASHRVIDSDRVVIYALDEYGAGTVIAESVKPGWSIIVNSTINDPCFGTSYFESYRQGRVKATDNISTEVSPCYLKQLQGFSVKANLVAPILKGKDLFGLLIAHQCSGPRHWQDFEIQWFTQLASQTGFALEKIQLLEDRAELQRQAERAIEWKTFFTTSTQKIHASLNPEDVLKTAVDQVRRVFACDRALIYSVDRVSMGVIIAESVNPNFPKALGRRIEDPCFEARYIKQYENGRVRAIDNIYDAGVTPCYIDQLEILEVKANLVAPVLHEGKLLGLLVAHQCSEPRHWTPMEIGWFEQIAVQVGYALDNAKLAEQVEQMAEDSANKLLLKDYFIDASRQIHASLDLQTVLDTSVSEVRRVLNCDRVLMYSVTPDSRGLVIAESVSRDFPKALGRRIDDPCFEAKYIQHYEDGRVRAINNIYDSGMTQCYLDQLEALAVKANLVAPVLHEGKILGLLVAHQCSEPRQWKPLEIDWFTQIAVQIGYAIDNTTLIGRVNQFSDNGDLQQRVSVLLESLSRDIQHQVDSATAATKHIQAVMESAQAIMGMVHQAEVQVQQTEQTMSDGHELLNQTVDHVSTVQQSLVDSAAKLKHLGPASKQISECLTLINDLGAQMSQEVMQLAISAGQTREGHQMAVLSTAEAVRFLNEQLVETTTSTESLVAELTTTVKAIGDSIEIGVDQSATGTRCVQETYRKLNEIAAVSDQLEMLISQLSQVAAMQVQSSTAASQITRKLADVAHQTSEHSGAIIQSFAVPAMSAIRNSNGVVQAAVEPDRELR
jgi:methyl-accepting chemotaxis protein PixJ